jgi:hypothetical protein
MSAKGEIKMSYRPKEYFNPYLSSKSDSINYLDRYEHDAYERGFDDAIKALLSKGIHAEEGEWITVRGGVLEDDDSLPVAGTWVFIPDGDKK